MGVVMSVQPESPRESVSVRPPRTVTRAPARRPAGGFGGTEFPYTPESVGTARHALADALQRMRVAPPAADDAVLILSELVSNALRHARPLAGGTIRVAWWMADDKVLRIAVTDGGRQQPEPAPHPEPAPPRPAPGGGLEALDLVAADLDDVDESAVDGRGLGIVGLLADDWGVEPWYSPETEATGLRLADELMGSRTASGTEPDPTAPKTVWAAVRLHARHAAPPPPDDHDRRWWRRMRVSLTAHLPGTGRSRGRGTRLGGSRLGEARGGPDGDTAGSDTPWVPRYPEARVGCAAAG